MVQWDERSLRELVRKIKVRRAFAADGKPIHLSLCFGHQSLLAKIVRLDTNVWSALGYDETDRVSVIRYLGTLGCLTEGAFEAAVYAGHLTAELARLLMDVGCDPAAQNDDGWDAFVWLAYETAYHVPRDGRFVDPQVTDQLLSAGCRTDLDGCKRVVDGLRSCFERLLREHVQWKESLERTAMETVPAGLSCDLDWSL